MIALSFGEPPAMGSAALRVPQQAPLRDLSRKQSGDNVADRQGITSSDDPTPRPLISPGAVQRSTSDARSHDARRRAVLLRRSLGGQDAAAFVIHFHRQRPAGGSGQKFLQDQSALVGEREQSADQFEEP